MFRTFQCKEVRMVSKNSSEKELGGTEKTVASVLLDYLALEGVDRIFGYPGTALGYVLNELRLLGAIDYVICRHESGAAYIADTYSRLTGKLGAVLVTTGPGATNALTGAMNAQSMNSSLLVISAEVPQKYWGRAALQAGVEGPLKIVEIYRHACEYSALISSPENFEELLKQALREAMSIPHRTVHISLPENLAHQALPDARVPASPSNYRAIPVGAPASQVAQVLGILVDSALPLIWLGNGCRRALFPGTRAAPDEAAKINARREGFFAFIERFCLPVVTTGDAKGLFPESNSLSLRNYGLGGGPWPSAYVNPERLNPGLNVKYDALCVLGSSLSQLATDSWAAEMIPDGPLIQVDADQSVIGRGYPIDLGIVAELGVFIDQLIELAAEKQPNSVRCDQRMRYMESVRNVPYPVPNPQADYIKKIAEHLPADSHVLVDACTADALALMYFVVDPPMQMHNSLVQGPIGSAIAGVVGAAFATERPCIAICGDGGFMMHGSEINTAAAHKLGCLWIVFQNQELGTVVQKMREVYPGRSGRTWEKLLAVGKADLVSFARGLGADAVEITSLDAIGPAVERALIQGREWRRPQVIVVPTEVYPIPPLAGGHRD
jgi:acetolactate synthase-1/2/3 large subunit